MIYAPAVSVSTASIPFGAAHRVDFDTPPLRGLRLKPFRFHLGSRRNNGSYTCRAFSAVPFGTMLVGWIRR